MHVYPSQKTQLIPLSNEKSIPARSSPCKSILCRTFTLFSTCNRKVWPVLLCCWNCFFYSRERIESSLPSAFANTVTGKLRFRLMPDSHPKGSCTSHLRQVNECNFCSYTVHQNGLFCIWETVKNMQHIRFWKLLWSSFLFVSFRETYWQYIRVFIWLQLLLSKLTTRSLRSLFNNYIHNAPIHEDQYFSGYFIALRVPRLCFSRRWRMRPRVLHLWIWKLQKVSQRDFSRWAQNGRL